ncbi:acireductone synthase [Streptomyces sp. RKAG293]|uniref:acireductone synthase n=1 Tax=Streptomyces sp. RKAG293 TaxID=2893403 RepID=UPI0020343176|nr:acireductone synthase [Streptomyces sp. RKAG293]MCM2416752.1 acireductone synthase [Streptomyces sp. RKAG293]
MSGAAHAARAVVLDIEGTTGSLSHVHRVLFPYARSRLANWMRDHEESDAGHAVLASVREATGTPQLATDQVVAVLQEWSDHDVKAAPLKTIQALIWADGYRTGELTGHVYPDVPVALARWKTSGIARYIYSSGAVAAQRDWFAHTAFGDLTPLLDGYFDLTTAGGKRDPASYRAIENALGMSADRIIFASDIGEELDAAATAGWQTVAVRRDDDPRGPAVPGYRSRNSLDGLLSSHPVG